MLFNIEKLQTEKNDIIAGYTIFKKLFLIIFPELRCTIKPLDYRIFNLKFSP